MFQGMEVLDGHVHYANPVQPRELGEVLDRAGTDRANLVLVPHRRRVSAVPEALKVKAMYPGRFFVFASLDVTLFFRRPRCLGRAMARYGRAMLRCGCDGIKIIEGKPSVRKGLPVPDFDSPLWEPFFAWAEAEQVPIVWHLNDPETFWDPETVPSWARERGWFYDSTYADSEDQYRQVLTLLEHHPRLRILFAHFFFLSAQLPRLSRILERFPGVMVDLTPGIELYENLTARPREAREFFAAWGDRIVFGTDTGAAGVLGENALSPEDSLRRSRLVLDFLSREDTFRVGGDGAFPAGEERELRGLGLPREALEKILSKNFLTFAGKETPAPVNPRLICRDCRRVARLIRLMALSDPVLRPPDTSCVRDAARYFKKQLRNKKREVHS